MYMYITSKTIAVLPIPDYLYVDMDMLQMTVWSILVLFTVHFVYLTVAVTLSFDGSQYFSLMLDEGLSRSNNTTAGEDISLRFLTDRENGLLLVTSAADTDDHLMIALDGGMVRVDVNINGVSKVRIFIMWNFLLALKL